MTTEQFEEMTAAFTKATGALPPGKDESPAAASGWEAGLSRQLLWNAFSAGYAHAQVSEIPGEDLSILSAARAALTEQLDRGDLIRRGAGVFLTLDEGRAVLRMLSPVPRRTRIAATRLPDPHDV